MENQFSNSTLYQKGWSFSLIFHGAVFALVVFLTSSVKPIQPSEPFRWEISLVTPPPTPVEQLRQMQQTSPRPIPPKQARPQPIQMPQEIRRTNTREMKSHVVAHSTPSIHHVLQKHTTSARSRVHSITHVKAEPSVTRNQTTPTHKPSPKVMHIENHLAAAQEIQSHHTHVIPVAEASPSLKRSVQSSTTPMTKSAASYTPAPAITAPPPLEQKVIVTGQASISPSSIVTNNPVAIPVAAHHQAPVQSRPFHTTPTSTASPVSNERHRTPVAHLNSVHMETTETAMRTVEERTITVMPSTLSESRTEQNESTAIRQVVASAPKTTSTDGVERTVVQRPFLTQSRPPQLSEALIHRDAPEMNEPVATGLSPEVLAFLNLLRQRIEQAREYPYAARRMGFEGTTTVKFALLPNGDLQSLTVSQPSGYPMLDAAAMETIQKILPLKPPAEAGNRPLSIEVPIKFWLN